MAQCVRQGMKTFRIYEHVIRDLDIFEQRIYKDVFYIGEPCGFMNRELEGDTKCRQYCVTRVLWQQKMALLLSDNPHQLFSHLMYDVLISDGYTINNLYVTLTNEDEDQTSVFRLGTLSQYRVDTNTSLLRTRNSNHFRLEIKPSTDEVGEFDMKVTTWVDGCLLYTSDAADE